MFRENEGSRDRDSTVVILKPLILYDLDRLPSENKTCKRNNKFFLVSEVQENFKAALCEAIENGSFQSHHKKKSLGLRLF